MNRQSLAYAASAAAQSGSMLACSVVCARIYAPSEYAQFAYLQSWVLLMALVLDFGLGQAALRQASIQNNQIYFFAALRSKAIIGAGAVAVAATIAVLLERVDIAVVGAAASASSYLLTLRVYQANASKTKEMILASGSMLVFCAIVCVAAMVADMSWVLLFALATVVAPVIGIALCVPVPLGGSIPSSLWRAAPPLWISALCFAALLPAQLVILKEKLHAESFATLALAVSLSGVVAMGVAAIRVTSYGRIARLGTEYVGAMYWRGLARSLQGFVLASVSAISGLAVFVHLVYSEKYPASVPVTITVALGVVLTAAVGFHNIRYQVLGMFRLEIAVNIMRLVAGVVVVLTVSGSAVASAIAIAATSVVFEMIYSAIGAVLGSKTKASVGAR